MAIDRSDILKDVGWPLRLTRLGLGAERATRAFWPVWSVVFVALALLMLGLQDRVAVEWVWATGAVLSVSALGLLVRGILRFRLPTRSEALERLDNSLRGRPIQAVLDRQAIGAGDAASLAVWQAHQARMRARLAEARAVEPDLRVSSADPFALRYFALLALSVAVLFGSIMRVQSVTTMGVGGPDLAQGPAWEGWMEPPGYTRLPAIYLNDITAPGLDVPQGAQITLRMYGEVGALRVEESVSGRIVTEEQAVETAQEFAVIQSGSLAIDGQGGRLWDIAMIPDRVPAVRREIGMFRAQIESEQWQITDKARGKLPKCGGASRPVEPLEHTTGVPAFWRSHASRPYSIEELTRRSRSNSGRRALAHEASYASSARGALMSATLPGSGSLSGGESTVEDVLSAR